jgi:hypothetical protein
LMPSEFILFAMARSARSKIAPISILNGTVLYRYLLPVYPGALIDTVFR